MKAIKLEVFQQHIILLCKGHYKYDNIFVALKQIWAIRCGYEYDEKDTRVYTQIANDLYNILITIEPKKIDYMMSVIHDEINKPYSPKGMPPIEALIHEYRSMIFNSPISELDEKTNKRTILVVLPKPMKRVFNRILKGNGRYKDYELINKRK